MASFKASTSASGFALAWLVLFGPGGCTSTAVPPPDGVCTHDLTVEATCTGGVDGGSAQALGLLGYTCTGTVRPDDHPTSIEGVPQGIICANQNAPSDGGTSSPQAYCCTNSVTPCALDPVAICPDPGTYAYQCRSENRPESYNAEVKCGQGVGEASDLIDYCCSGTPQPPGCTQVDSLGCAADLMGFRCNGLQSLPSGEDLGANKSRADQFYLLCPIPTASAQVGLYTYCCFTAALVPPGGSCLQDTAVPNCQPGQYGIACTGTDTPPQDYAPLVCPNPGVRGTSAEGYPATLYCCDLQ